MINDALVPSGNVDQRQLNKDVRMYLPTEGYIGGLWFEVNARDSCAGERGREPTKRPVRNLAV